MVKVEQIRLLETKVQNAMKYIERLRNENGSLRKSLETYELRISDLETVVSDFRNSQEEIEKGIENALRQLDQLEDEVVDQPSGDNGTAAEPKASPKSPTRNQARTNTSPGPATSSEPRHGMGAKASAHLKAEQETPFPGEIVREPEPSPPTRPNRDVATNESDEEESEATQTSESELDIF